MSKFMKKTKQTAAVILSLVIMLSTVLGQFPASIRAAAARYGISNPRRDSEGVTTWDCIWFGNYWQSSETAKEPIKWRVLSVNGDDAFLLADQNLDSQCYETRYVHLTWEVCSLRTWLNSTFYQNAFSSAEQAAIRTTTVVNEDNPSYGTEGGYNTQDKVYLLSIAEASNEAYGFNTTFNVNSETRYSKNTEYAKVQGAYTSTSYAGNGWWWLRSPGRNSIHAANVFDDGRGFSSGDEVVLDSIAVRPALHINLSSNTWSKAGIVSSSGGSAGGVMATPVSTGKPDSMNNNQDVVQKPEPTIVPVSENTELKDSKGVVYTVTKSGLSEGEVAYTAPRSKNVISITIPATVKLSGITYKVTSIKTNAFKNCKKFKKVTIGKNIKIIGKKAFYGCGKLRNITIKTTKLTNKSVGSKAFAEIHKKAKLKVPKKKLSAYKKLLKKKGVTGKKQKIKK